MPTNYERLFALREDLVETARESPPKTDKQSAIQDLWRIIHGPCAAEVAGWLKALLNPDRWVWEGAGAKEKAVRLQPKYLWSALTHQWGPIHASLGGAANRYARSRVVWKAKMVVGTIPGHNAAIGSKAEVAAQKKDAAAKLAEKTKKIQADYKATFAAVMKDWTARRDLLEAQAADFREIVGSMQIEDEERLAALAARLPSGPDAVAAADRVDQMRSFRRKGALDHWGSNLSFWSQQRYALQELVGEEHGQV